MAGCCSPGGTAAAAPSPPAGTRVVAVLPFDNLGDSSDAYFADGVSDEVRTKLGKVAGLEVIARGSSRSTGTPPSVRARSATSWEPTTC